MRVTMTSAGQSHLSGGLPLRFVAIAALVVGIFAASGLLSSSAREVQEGTALGQKAIPLVGESVDGDRISLGNLRGRFAMLSFWTPDCPLCAKELPMYDAYYRKVGADRLSLLGVLLAQNLSSGELRELVEERKYSFPIAVFTGRDALRLMKDWKVTATPANYLVNPDGIIVLKGFLGNEGMALAQKIVDKQPEFLPPEMELETALLAEGQIMSYRVSFPDASAGRYSFVFRAAAQYVNEDGRRGELEEVAPVSLRLSQDTKGVVQAKAMVEARDRSGKPAKLSSPSHVRAAAKRIGRTVYVEVDLPLPSRVPLALAEVKYYSEPLKAYIVLDSGYPP